MNKYLAMFFDNYGLYEIHQKRSKQAHFRCNLSNPLPLDELGTVFSDFQIPQITFKKQRQHNNYIVGRYSYKSDIQSNFTCNNYAIGQYYLNEEPSNTNIVILHGWRMTQPKRVEKIFLPKFLKQGYNIYFPTLPFHNERTPQGSFNGELMISSDIDRTLLSTRQIVLELRALINYLKTKENSKVVLIGLSLGGQITNLMGVIENQIDLLISIFYANNLALSVWDTIPGKFIKKDFEDHNFTYEQLQRYWAIIEPSNFKPVVPRDKILLFSALYDQYIDRKDSDRLWENWERPARILYPCGHSGIVFNRGKLAKDISLFIRNNI